MIENKIVTLIHYKKEYDKFNLSLGVSGIVLKTMDFNKKLVLFLNDSIEGDYAVCPIYYEDIKEEDIKLPKQVFDNIVNFVEQNEKQLLKKQSLKNLEFKEYDSVKLIADREEYSSKGLHKGDIGVIAINYDANDSILVDFSSVDNNGNYFGECIKVKLKDLVKV